MYVFFFYLFAIYYNLFIICSSICFTFLIRDLTASGAANTKDTFQKILFLQTWR